MLCTRLTYFKDLSSQLSHSVISGNCFAAIGSFSPCYKTSFSQRKHYFFTIVANTKLLKIKKLSEAINAKKRKKNDILVTISYLQ